MVMTLLCLQCVWASVCTCTQRPTHTAPVDHALCCFAVVYTYALCCFAVVHTYALCCFAVVHTYALCCFAVVCIYLLCCFAVVCIYVLCCFAPALMHACMCGAMLVYVTLLAKLSAAGMSRLHRSKRWDRRSGMPHCSWNATMTSSTKSSSCRAISPRSVLCPAMCHEVH